MDVSRAMEELIDKGGPMIWPLLFCSVLVLTIVLERIFFWCKDAAKKQTILREKLLNAVENNDVEGVLNEAKDSTDPVVLFLKEGLEHRSNDPTLAMEINSRYQVKHMNRNLSFLDVIVTLAPILGILGTVFGIIESFDLLGQRGLQDPHEVTGGVARALISTAAGLVVAIMAMIPVAILRSRCRHRLQTFEIMARRLMLVLGKDKINAV